ncbi:dihydroxyacetone kinase subunit DhaL [Kribbella sp. DT2]|uniref:dihydroxyacetone kinase subunit DhaL n=1 Tax=Kribbella sp. DT2 TaxID=3393427 RepID=UPI003CF60B02
MGVESFTNWLRDLAGTMHENAAYLTELDSAIGDADHGSNMDRGFQAVVAVLDETTFDSVDELLKKAGMTLVSKVGGASGPLYGTFFLRFGTALAGVEVTPATVGEALKAGVGGILARGKAEVGDKTMYDAWAPALTAYEEAVAGGSELRGALVAAAEAAAKGRDETAPLVARKGRASYLGERSVGHQDPGATSTTLLLESAARTLG